MSDRTETPTTHRRKRDLHPFKGMTRRWFLRLEWKPQDCWIGVFWRRDYPWSLDVWVCVLPMAPLHFGWNAQVGHGPGSGSTPEDGEQK